MEQEIAKFFLTFKDTLLFDASQIISSRIYIFITCAVFITYAFVKVKHVAFIFLFAALMSVAASDIICYRVLKPLIGRPRPSIELNIGTNMKLQNQEKQLTDKDYSMPSNHASNIFAFFIVYFLYIKRHWYLLLLNSLLISASRIILVKHYPSDIFAGAAVGIILGLCTVFLFRILKISQFFTKNKER
ncbi:MAG: phosphatase PAP2 family protein [Spirochaetota bacterium]